MASTVNKARSKLPKRFRPLYDQAQSETAIRYGAAQDALGTIFGQTTRDYQRQAAAQQTMAQSLLGSLGAAGGKLDKAYSDAGLTPELRGQIANSPTGQRIASELASGQADIQDQLIGVQAGQQYIQGDLADKYREDVGAINQQLRSLLTERGLFEQNRLGGLIGEDRARRSAANADARKLQYDAEQAILDRDAAMGNALIGQGLVVDDKGNLTPLPGGKADPNAAKPKKSKPTGADRTVQGDMRKAASWIDNLDDPTFRKAAKVGNDPAERRKFIEGLLRRGDQASGIPSITSVGLDAALDIYFDKGLSAATVKALHDAGAKVKFIGAKTQAQRRREARLLPMGGRTGTARSRDEQLG